ncbi:hypothetical protein SK128_022251, partial [Halocaridina rubra]
DHNDEIRQEQMREMQVLNGRTGLPVEAGDAHTDTSGSLSPPNSLSPPPSGPVKLPNAQQIAAAQAAAAAVNPPIAHALLTHPAMRGLTRAQLGLMTTVPNMAAPAVPGAMLGRFPTLLPIGSVAPMAQPAAARSMPLYEDYTDVANMQTDFDPTSVVTDSDKKDGALKAGAQVARGRFRHEPYRRVAINVPA